MSGENPDPVERLDWLLLLPTVTAEPSVVVLGEMSASAIDRLARHVGASEVRRTADGRPADLLVVRHGNLDDVTVALAALRDDGVAFIECPGTTLRLRRSLARRDDVRRYLVAPNLVTPKRWVPNDHPNAIRWYLDTLFAPIGLPQRVVRRALTVFPALSRFALRDHAMVLGPGGSRRPELLDAVAEQIPGHPDAESLVVLTSGHDVGSRSVALLFDEGDRNPRSVVKVSTQASADEAIRAEQGTLNSLVESLPHELRRRIPVPYGLVEWRAHVASAESAMEGPTVERVLRTATVGEQVDVLRRVAAWITEFHLTTVDRESWGLDTQGSQVATLVERYRSLHDPEPRVDALLERVLARAGDIGDRAVPIVRRHYDFAPWNMLDGPEGLGVIDWETGPARPRDGRGLPLCDLDYFVKYWLHIVADATTSQHAETLSIHGVATDPGQRWSYEEGRSIIRAYCANVGVDIRLVPVLAVCNWVEHAVNDALRADLLCRPRPAGSNSLVNLRRLASNADHLFSVWDGAAVSRRP